MPARFRTAHEWASNATAEHVRLADLDLYVLQPHPHIVRALGREPLAERTFPWGDLVLMVTAVPAGLAALALGPAWLRQATSEPWLEPVDLGDNAITVAAGLFLVSLVGSVLSALVWWRNGRRSHSADMMGLALTVVAGVVALWLIGDVPGRHATPVAIVLAALVTAGVVLAAAKFASTGSRPEDPPDFRIDGQPDWSRASALVAELSEKKQAKLAADRRRTLRRLQQQGVIDEATVSRVEALPLGQSLTLDA